MSLNVAGTVYVNSSNWGSVFSKANISAANTIANALNYITVQAGPITNVKVLTSSILLSEKTITALDAAGAEYETGRYSKSLKSIGRYKVNYGGSNYKKLIKSKYMKYVLLTSLIVIFLLILYFLNKKYSTEKFFVETQYAFDTTTMAVPTFNNLFTQYPELLNILKRRNIYYSA